MSRFADANSTKRVELGACQCPGAPHESDWADIRTQLGYEEHAQIARAGAQPLGLPYDNGAAKLKLAQLGVVAWNLLDNDGAAVPVSRDAIGRLDPGTLNRLADELDDVLGEWQLPNGSGAP